MLRTRPARDLDLPAADDLVADRADPFVIERIPAAVIVCFAQNFESLLGVQPFLHAFSRTNFAVPAIRRTSQRDLTKNSVGYRKTDALLRRLLSMVQSGRFDPTPLITHSFSLDQIVEAYEFFGSRRDGVLKVAVRP